MIIERNYTPEVVEVDEVGIGDVISDENGEGLYLLVGITPDDKYTLFDLESNRIDVWHHKARCVTRKAKLVLED